MAGPRPGTWDAVLLTEMRMESLLRGGATEKLKGNHTKPQVPAPGRDVGQGGLRTCGRTREKGVTDLGPVDLGIKSGYPYTISGYPYIIFGYPCTRSRYP